MSKSLIDFIQYFSQITRLDSNTFNMIPTNILLGIFFALCAFLGYKTIRYVYSLIVFFLTILIIVNLLQDRTAWLYVATTFSVLSIVFAFMAHFSKRLSGLIVITLMVYASLIIFNLNWMLVIILSISLGLIAYVYPFISVVLITSVLGSFELSQLISDSLVNKGYIFIVLIIFSLLFQIFSNSEGRLLLKKMKGKWYESRLS